MFFALPVSACMGVQSFERELRVMALVVHIMTFTTRMRTREGRCAMTYQKQNLSLKSMELCNALIFLLTKVANEVPKQHTAHPIPLHSRCLVHLR